MDSIDYYCEEFNKNSKRLSKMIDKQIENDKKEGLHSKHADKVTKIIVDYIDSMDVLLNALVFDHQQQKMTKSKKKSKK